MVESNKQEIKTTTQKKLGCWQGIWIGNFDIRIAEGMGNNSNGHLN